jgi:outer membrane protein
MLIWIDSKTPKIAFVKSIMVLEEYQGMIEVNELLSSRISIRENQIDSLNQNLNKITNKLKNEKLTTFEKNELEFICQNRQLELNQYIKELKDLTEKEDDKLKQGILNQINENIKIYAEQNDYDLIIGVTLSGNVLYGSETIDITNEIIDFLNNNYLNK